MPPRSRSIAGLLLSIVSVLGLAGVADAQGSSITSGLDLSAVAPPAFARPGARITFYSAAASVAQSSYQLIEDPSGQWEDPVTGKRYRSTEDTGESLGGASGDGVSQVDVVAVEGNDVVLSMTTYGIDRATNTLAVLPGVGVRVPGGAVDGLWMAPQLLATLQTGSLGGLLVLRGDYPLNGTTYQAVSIVDATPGAYSSQTFDSVSGVLLASTTNTAGATSPVQLPGQGPVQGPSELTISRFVGIRQLVTPGTGSAAPAWVANTPGLSYAGRYQLTNPVDPSSGSLTFPMTTQVSFSGTGPTWATFGLRTVVDMGGVSSPSDSSGVSSGTGPYWWDPAALARLPTGQVLDTDPVTTLTVTVTDVRQGPAGPAVTITSRFPGTTGQATYDVATGVLVDLTLAVASSGADIQLALQQMP